jgi:hypothetical protein
MTVSVAQVTTSSRRQDPPDKALRLTANPLRGLSAAELGRLVAD